MLTFEPIQPVLGLNIKGKVEINVKNANIQDLYRKFGENLTFVKYYRWADSFFCFIENQTMNNNASGAFLNSYFDGSNLLPHLFSS